MEKLTRDQVEIQKVTIAEKGVEVQAVVQHIHGSVGYTEEVKGFDTKLAQPSLSTPFCKNLKQFARDVLFDTRMEFFKTGEGNIWAKELMPTIERWKIRLLEAVLIERIEIVGEEDKRGVIIIGKRMLPSTIWVPFKTPAIRFSATYYGWESDLEEEIDYILDEAFEYKFNGACGDPELTDGLGNARTGVTKTDSSDETDETDETDLPIEKGEYKSEMPGA